MSLEEYWRKFASCDTCGAGYCQPCHRMRDGKPTGKFCDMAHAGRPWTEKAISGLEQIELHGKPDWWRRDVAILGGDPSL